tara:strand:- start:1439 stop:1669 length:231 start_codon:yes stop_codon:yes gene_type:complete
MINKIPRQRIYKNEDIYVCIACDGMYTIEMIDEHLIKCSKMPEWEKQRAEEQEQEQEQEMEQEQEQEQEMEQDDEE